MPKHLLHHPTHVRNKANTVLPHTSHLKLHLISTQTHLCTHVRISSVDSKEITKNLSASALYLFSLQGPSPIIFINSSSSFCPRSVRLISPVCVSSVTDCSWSELEPKRAGRKSLLLFSQSCTETTRTHARTLTHLRQQRERERERQTETETIQETKKEKRERVGSSYNRDNSLAWNDISLFLRILPLKNSSHRS